MRLDDPLRPEFRPYQPFGAAREAIRCRDREVLLDGPAGTGKTLANLNKIYMVADKYPKARIAIVRKTRASLTETVLVTWENHVVPVGHPCLDGAHRRNRQSYEFPNGSTVALFGFDKSTRLLSSEWDIIYVAEAIEVTLEEWETLTSRLRSYKVPYQQMLADTNPGATSHWLNQRANEGTTTRFWSRHEDNPMLWDREREVWTEKGADYIRRLDALSGVRLKRYRYGQWCAAEGQIYDEWDPAVHIVDKVPVMGPTWWFFWAIDFGYTNPLVWQYWGVDPDGRLWLLREIYRTEMLVEDLAQLVRHVGYEYGRPRFVVCDHDAEDRATLERHLGITTRAAKKNVSPGIQLVKSRLRRAGDGRPRLMLYRQALCHTPDLLLAEAKKPVRTAEEFESYVWDESPLKGKKDQPAKAFDHGMDAMRYGVAEVDGIRNSKVIGFD